MSTAFTQLQPIPLDNALPTQNTNTAGQALISNGSTAQWNTVLAMIGTNPGQTLPSTLANTILPTQTGKQGFVLSTDGAGNLSWKDIGVGSSYVTSITIGTQQYTGDVTITTVPAALVAGNVTGVVAIANGGTGATSPAQALINLNAAAANHTHSQYAPLASPAFTGTPTAPTAPVTTNTTQLATTAFVQGVLSNQFAQKSLSSIGYQILPGGLILQWGYASLVIPDTQYSSVNTTIAFPITFPNAVFLALAGTTTGLYDNNTNADECHNFVTGFTSLTTSSGKMYAMRIRGSGNGVPVSFPYIAIGF